MIEKNGEIFCFILEKSLFSDIVISKYRKVNFIL